MGKKKQINIALADEQRSRWKEYVDESPQYDSVADLVRTGVEKEIKGGHQIETATQSSEMNPEVLDTLRGMKGTLDDLVVRVAKVEEESRSTPTHDLIPAIVSTLPTAPEGEQTERFGEVYTGEEEYEQMTVEDIARRVGASKEDTEETLQSLIDTTGLVYSRMDDDGTYYYKRE